MADSLDQSKFDLRNQSWGYLAQLKTIVVASPVSHNMTNELAATRINWPATTHQDATSLQLNKKKKTAIRLDSFIANANNEDTKKSWDKIKTQKWKQRKRNNNNESPAKGVN